MHFDAITLACVNAELNQKLLPGRVQQVLLVDEQSIGLEIYASQQRQYLLLTADPAAARVHLVPEKLRRGPDSQPPLLLLLRKYVRNAILDTITQPDPSERVLRLGFEHAEHGSTTLIIELIGRTSNLILTGPGAKILDCLRRVRGGDADSRSLWPGAIYSPPPKPDKIEWRAANDAALYAQFEKLLRQEGRLWRALVDGVAGVSPTLAREIAWRATGDSQAAVTDANIGQLVQAFRELWQPVQNGDWQPGLVWEDGQLVGFTPYPIHFRGQFESTPSISQAVARLYGAQRHTAADAVLPRQTADAYAAQRGAVKAAIRKVRNRLARNLDALTGEEPAPGAVEQLRTQAEWLLALSSQIAEGQAQLEIALDEQPLTIALDPHKTPVEQAEAMFKRAAKLARAAEFIPQRRATLQADMEFLAQLEMDLQFAENQPEIQAVENELRKTGLIAQRKRAKVIDAPTSAQPLRYLSPDGLAILVGRNARQNEQVTFKLAGADDLWLHAHGAPGAHVVVRNGGQPVSEETLHMAAQLAGHYSGLRGEKAAPIAVTTRRFVTRVPGGRTGQVHVRNADTITVAAEVPDDAILSPERSKSRSK
ncbi:MAG: NFACT RNA binding domain-containing protein [Caldilineaceae bacterium]